MSTRTRRCQHRRRRPHSWRSIGLAACPRSHPIADRGIVEIALDARRRARSLYRPKLHGAGPPGSRLSVSAQSIHRNAAADQALDELGLEAGAPAAISLDAGSLPAGGVSLTRTLPKPVAGDADAALAFFDEEHRAWTVVPTSLSPSRRELRADVDHLSLWTDIQYGAGWLLDARVDPPACSGSPPDWVQEDGIIFVDDANAPLRWCAGRDPQDADVLVVKVALNRSYGVGVRPVVRPEWTFDTLFGGGPETFATTLVTRGAGALGLLGEAYGGHIPLMGGMEAHFGFTEQQVRSIGGPALIRVSLDAKFALAGFTYRALHELAGEGKLGKQASAIAALVAIAQCQSDLGRGAQRGEWQALAQAGVFLPDREQRGDQQSDGANADDRTAEREPADPRAPFRPYRRQALASMGGGVSLSSRKLGRRSEANRERPRASRLPEGCSSAPETPPTRRLRRHLGGTRRADAARACRLRGRILAQKVGIRREGRR